MLATIALICLMASAKSVPKQKKAVYIREVRGRGAVSLFVENQEAFDVTVTLIIQGQQVKVSRLKPETETYPAFSKTEAVRAVVSNTHEPWRLNYNFHWVKGSRYARHDDQVMYRLPFQSGTSHRVTQGYHGKLSHQGQDQYAVDFGMREGTAVCAARAGVVVDLNEASQSGGPTKDHKSESNYVCLAQEDGTIAEYHHLQYNGVLVEVGQHVIAGQRIALSGNTGYSTRPHLHFVVYSAVDGWRLQSHQVTFITRQGTIADPVEGNIYTAK